MNTLVSCHYCIEKKQIFFRKCVVDGLENDREFCQGFRSILHAEEIDSLLYASIPLFYSYELKNRLKNL